jgi:branched-chain amino acid transport system permease protein
MGVGAYTVALLTTRLGWNFWICFVLAGIITALMALIIGFISLRTKGFYFAIATFAIAEVIRLTWIEWSSVFGGVGGIANIPPPDPILGFKFCSVLSFYYLSLLLIIVTTFIMHCLEVSRFGLIVTTFEEADDLAESVGINVTLYKNISYVIGSFFAGCAGAIFGPFYHYIGPDDFSVQQSFYIVIYILAGGADSVYGTLIGVFVIMVTLTLVHLIPGYNPVWEPLVLGSILLIIMKVLPGGLLSLVQKTSF